MSYEKSKLPPRRRLPENSLLEAILKFLKANLALIVTILICSLVVYWMGVRNRSKRELAPTPAETPVALMPQNKKSNLPFKAQANLAKRESSPQELNNIKEEDPTPEFIKEHKILLLEELTTELQGGEIVLQQTKDPKAAAEVAERIEALKRFKKLLDNVNPNDPDTWKVLMEAENKQKGKSSL